MASSLLRYLPLPAVLDRPVTTTAAVEKPPEPEPEPWPGEPYVLIPQPLRAAKVALGITAGLFLAFGLMELVSFLMDL